MVTVSKRKRAKSSSLITDTAYAFRQSRILLTAIQLGVFTGLGDQRKTASEVAKSLGTDDRATDRLMDALCAMGLLAKKNGQFLNTPVSSRFLVKGMPDYMAGLMHTAHLWHTWGTLTEAVRAGTSVATSSGGNHVETGWTDAFIAAMHMRSNKSAPAVVKTINLKRVRRVLDVGGGSGAYAMAFARAKKDIEVVVFDLPTVTPLTHKYIRAEKLDNRIQIVSGDYTKDAIGYGYDLVFLSAIIHSNSIDINRLLFKKAFDALNPGGQLVIRDHIMDEDRTGPLAGAFFSLNMLVGTRAGDTFTESEIRGWMAEVGFMRIRCEKNPDGPGQIVGRKFERKSMQD